MKWLQSLLNDVVSSAALDTAVAAVAEGFMFVNDRPNPSQSRGSFSLALPMATGL